MVASQPRSVSGTERVPQPGDLARVAVGRSREVQARPRRGIDPAGEPVRRLPQTHGEDPVSVLHRDRVPGPGLGRLGGVPPGHGAGEPAPLDPEDVGHEEAVAGEHPRLTGGVGDLAAGPFPRSARPPPVCRAAAEPAGDRVQVFGGVRDPPAHLRRPHGRQVDGRGQCISPLRRRHDRPPPRRPPPADPPPAPSRPPTAPSPPRGRGTGGRAAPRTRRARRR